MAVDFKTNRIRTYSIIASGSQANAPAIWIQGSGSATNFTGGSLLSLLSNVGNDTFLFVSGGIGQKNIASTKSTAVFGGDVVISGTLYDGAGTAYSPGAGGAPGSPVNSVQFNSAGSFGGNSNFTYTATGGIYLTGSLAQGDNAKATGNYSHATGKDTQANGTYSHAEGRETIAAESYSHAEGAGSISNGESSHAEGASTIAYAIAAHSEGAGSEAWGLASHAEGWGTKAEGWGSHSSGYFTTSSGDYSFSAGDHSISSGTFSLAAGIGTIASGSGQTTLGSYNLRNDSTSLFVIGNGSGDLDVNRSNLLIAKQTSIELTGSFNIKGSITPDADFTYNLGTAAKRWQNVYTGDLHLRNDRGDWTIVEEEDFLCVINNKSGKRFKMMLQPID